MVGGKRKLSPMPAAPSPSKDCLIEIPARHAIAPYAQGQLDRLCGLYAAINAIRLTLHGERILTTRHARGLLEVGAEYLQRKDAVAASVAQGMKVRRWHALARHLAVAVSDHQLTVELEPAEFVATPAIADVFAWIDDSLVQGKPVLVHLSSGINHFTVIAGSTPTKLLLFDSCGLRFVKRASCGIRSGFHHIPPKALMRVAVRGP